MPCKLNVHPHMPNENTAILSAASAVCTWSCVSCQQSLTCCSLSTISVACVSRCISLSTCIARDLFGQALWLVCVLAPTVDMFSQATFYVCSVTAVSGM